MPPTARRVLKAFGSKQGRSRPEPRWMLSLYPEIEEVTVTMGEVSYRRSNQDPLERFFLGALCQMKKPRRVFEIGTYDGSTTLVVARNAPEAEILTLDLPPGGAATATDEAESRHVAEGGIGSAFARTPEAARITQLYGDSRTFDFTPWLGSVDLVIVDAGHTYPFVKADTETALRLIRDGGAIVWDDYIDLWPDVIRAVDEAGLPIVRVGGTGLAVFDGAVTGRNGRD